LQQKNNQSLTSEENADSGSLVLISIVIDSICDVFIGENTAENIQLLIIKSLQCAISNQDERYKLNGTVLLKVIRTVYNIFLLSNSIHVQEIAQAGVIQMISRVFDRICPGIHEKHPSYFKTTTSRVRDNSIKNSPLAEQKIKKDTLIGKQPSKLETTE
jgi:brefeldin A-inhibited guanine nucleotide-exchange protein